MRSVVPLFLVLVSLAAVINQADSRASSASVTASSISRSSLQGKRLANTKLPMKEDDLLKKIEESTAVVGAESNANNFWRGVACIIGGALAHLTFGTMYCWGNFLSYAPDSLRFFDGKLHPGTPPDALYVLPFTLVAQALSMPFGPSLTKAVGASRTMLIGSLITALATYLASKQTTLQTFVLAYSLLFGVGAGLGYTSPMAAGWKWLPESKGLVSGGILAGFGAGGFVFSLIGSKLVNPDKLNPVNGRFAESVYAAFPSMLQKLAVMYAVTALVGSFLVSEPAEPAAATPAPVVAPANSKAGAPKAPKAPATAPSTTVASLGLSVSEALKTSQFWLMWAMVISSATTGLNTASIYKQFAATAPTLTGDEYQTLVGGIGALFNGGGRLFWGIISDKIGFKNSFSILTLLQMGLMLTYEHSVHSKVRLKRSLCLLCRLS